MSDYWRRVIAILRRVSNEGTEQERIATYRIIEQIEEAEADRPASPLEDAWDRIKDLLEDLSLEPYIDDQIQITEIWEIVEELIRQGGLEKEPWDLKEKILQEIYVFCGCESCFPGRHVLLVLGLGKDRFHGVLFDVLRVWLIRHHAAPC